MEPFDSKRKPGPEHMLDMVMHHNEGDTPDATEDTTTTQQEAVVPYPVINTVDNHPTTHTMNEQRVLTNGEIAMSVDFNPNQNLLVAAIKSIFADTYDQLENAVNQAASNVTTKSNDPKNAQRISSIRRWEAIAKTDLEKAQMAAVKAITR